MFSIHDPDILGALDALNEDESWVPQLIGFERGTNQMADVIFQSADGADLNRMWREFNRALDIFNRERDPLLNMLTFDVTNPAERVLQPSTEDFEEATEFGEPKGIRIGKPFNLGYSFKWYDIAIRYTWQYLLEAKRDALQALNRTALDGGRRLYFSRVFRRIFNNVNETATIDEQSVNVYTLYNADGTVPPAYENNTFNGSHTHFLTSGAATLDPGDLATLEDDLASHGYRFDLGYELVLVVNKQEGSVIRTFVAGQGTPASRYTFIHNPANRPGGVILPMNGGIIGTPEGSLPQQIGTWGPFKVVEMSLVPAGYMFAFATGGEQNLGNLVGIRQHENPAGRGLRLVQGPNPNYPLTDSFYSFGFGTGVRHRGGGIVMQVTASGSYTIPALYA
ncbi:MAG: hypothetical protein ACRD8U_19580 [Pyrinomonadaceae bacterium]